MSGYTDNKRSKIHQVEDPALVGPRAEASLQDEPTVVDTVLVDMDGVLCDFERQFVARWQEAFPETETLPVENRKTHYVFDDPAGVYDVDRTNQLICAAGFYETIPEIPGAVKALLQMEEELGVKVVICTAPWCSLGGGCCPKCPVEERCEREKRTWMATHFGPDWASSDKLICVKDKTRVPGRLLIDDKPNPLRGGTGTATWQHVVFSQPFNVSDPVCEGKPRLNSWAEWREVLLPLLGRVPSQAADSERAVEEESPLKSQSGKADMELDQPKDVCSDVSLAQLGA